MGERELGFRDVRVAPKQKEAFGGHLDRCVSASSQFRGLRFVSFAQKRYASSSPVHTPV